jgi:hypothetical protein
MLFHVKIPDGTLTGTLPHVRHAIVGETIVRLARDAGAWPNGSEAHRRLQDASRAYEGSFESGQTNQQMAWDNRGSKRE